MTRPVTLPVVEHSTLDTNGIVQLLDNARIPLRLACRDRRGHPVVTSLWFYFEAGRFFCACHRDARVVQYLRDDARCGFEIAADTPPYRGVRGQGRASLEAERGEPVLRQLLQRYSIAEDSKLARWLLSRGDEEIALVIEPGWVSGWDYTERMTD